MEKKTTQYNLYYIPNCYALNILEKTLMANFLVCLVVCLLTVFMVFRIYLTGNLYNLESVLYSFFGIVFSLLSFLHFKQLFFEKITLKTKEGVIDRIQRMKEVRDMPDN